jgi:hypothetical protein
MVPRSLFRMVLSLVLAACATAACRENPAAPADVPLGQPFELRAGTSAVVPGGLRITFDRVVSDSRCPIDAICVWAGEAVLAIKLSQGQAEPVARELRADSASPEIEYQTYRIRVTALAPHPRSDRQIAPREFVATFVVNR